MKATTQRPGGMAAYATAALCLLTLCLCMPAEVSAQWTTPDASGNINNTNTGNVGVGTTAPQATLHVSTASIATGSRGIIDEQTSNDANGALFIVRKSRAGTAAQNGDIIGNFYASAYDGTNWVSGGRLRFAIDGPVSAGVVPTALQFITGVDNSTIERMRITSGGNVGINTASPYTKFQLNNKIGDDNSRVYDSNAFMVVHQTPTSTTTLNDPKPVFYLGRQGTPGQAYGAMATFSLSRYENAGGSSVGSRTRLDIGLTHDNFNDAGVMTLLSNGNVGVGTTAPASLLEVRRNQATGTEMRVSNTDAAGFAGVYLNGGFGQAAGGFLQWNNVTGNNNLFMATGGNFPLYLGTNNSVRMTVMPTSGNVGIGTSSPGARLDVGAGAAARGSYSDLLIGTGGNNPQVEFYGPTKSSAIAHDEPMGGLVFYTNGPAFSPAFFVGNNSNVGVGTTAPGYKLEVSGNVNASGLCLGGDCKTAWSQIGGSSQWANGASSSINYGSGNVGVGTTTPATKLHVVGGTRLEGTGRLYLGTGAVQGARGLEIIEENATTFSIRHHDPAVAWQNIAINPYGGRVGVGTVNPLGAFEVAGGSIFMGDMGNAGWGNVIVRGRVTSANNNIHLSPPGGSAVYIDSNYREAGGATGPVNLNVSGDVIAGGNISAKYQDVAEWVPSTQKLAAGTVVVLDKSASNHVLASSRAYDTKVAGVVSLQPGIALGVGGEGKLLVATTGRVKIKVDASRGAIEVGDLLVTSEVEGVAMKSVAVELGGVSFHRPGTIIGKALEPLEKGTGEILVLLSLQ